MPDDEREDRVDPEVRRNTKCTIYLSYTSNMISSGVRETICFLVKHKMVSAQCLLPASTHCSLRMLIVYCIALG